MLIKLKRFVTHSTMHRDIVILQMAIKQQRYQFVGYCFSNKGVFRIKIVLLMCDM